MPLALTANQKLGIALIAGAFVAFALVSSFVFPRRDVNFPGTRLPLFIAVTALLVLAMMTAMAVLAQEAEVEQPAAERTPDERTARTGTQPPRTTQTTPTTEPTERRGEAQGDLQAGKVVFASAGCGGCHTLEEADANGTVGPNLDESSMPFDEAAEQIRKGGNGMPPFEDQLSDEQIRDVAAFVVEAAEGG